MTAPPRTFKLCASCQHQRPIESFKSYKNSANRVCYHCSACLAAKERKGEKISTLPSWAKSSASAAWKYACNTLVPVKSPAYGYYLDLKIRGLPLRHYETLRSARIDCSRQRVMLAAEKVLSTPTSIKSLPRHIFDKVCAGTKQQEYCHLVWELAKWVIGMSRQS